MMYVVSYTFNPNRVNLALAEELKKSGGGNWWHNLDSTWIVATHETAEQLFGRIRQYFLDTDSFLIIEIKSGSQRYGWLPKPAWEWIDSRYREGWAT